MSDETSVSDAEFIARTKAGDVEAFGELYRRYITPIFRYVRARVSTDRDAEDLTENVFLKVFEALDTYQERGAPFGAFLYRVARNAVVDHYRSQKPLEEIDELASLGEIATSAEKYIVDKEAILEIKNAMTRLPENYQEVIRLRVLMELPTEDVAQWMGKQPSTVRVLLHRALKALRKSLGVVDER
jgi:RNA polymerase sigma-70 factor (ECF subfamily)